jgi:hypothetical protein
VLSFNSAVVAGGSGTAECTKVTAANAATFQVRAKTLEELAQLNPGKPCVFGGNANVGPRNEWWSNGTLSIGTVDANAPAYPAYTSTRSLRVAFGSDRNVTYYGCSIQANGGSSRNCDVLGTGTYSVEALGDARVMRFAGVPADAAPLGYSREFVERGGTVYYGYRTKLRQSYQVRPNLEATDALFAPLGIVR